MAGNRDETINLAVRGKQFKASAGDIGLKDAFEMPRFAVGYHGEMDASPKNPSRSVKRLRLVLCLHLVGAACAGLAVFLDRPGGWGFLLPLTVFVGVGAFFVCPLAVLALVFSSRISAHNALAAVGLEALIELANFIAILPSCQ
jgi:hypothetical protein